MAYLAVDHPEQLTRGDFARLAYATAPGDRHGLPFSREYLARFEENHCYDRYYDEAHSGGGLSTRVMCCDHAFITVGDAARPIFTDAERGVLAQFRHQFFLLALIAHMHKAALLMMSDRLVQAVTRLDIENRKRCGGSAPRSGACWKYSFASPIATGFTMSPTMCRRATCFTGWPSISARSGCTLRFAKS